MAQKDGLDKRIQQVAEIGIENAKLIPQVKNWCQHINVQSSKAGMVAELYNVPTRNTITCDHAESGLIQSMYLRDVATSFIINNCRNCPHHKSITEDNLGRIILDEYEAYQTKKVSEENKQKATKARLRGLISGDLNEVLQSEHVTIQSILKLIALLDDESTHIEAAQKLVQAAQIAPELFSDLGVEVICSHFVDPKHGGQCIEVIRELCHQRNKSYQLRSRPQDVI